MQSARRQAMALTASRMANPHLRLSHLKRLQSSSREWQGQRHKGVYGSVVFGWPWMSSSYSREQRAPAGG